MSSIVATLRYKHRVHLRLNIMVLGLLVVLLALFLIAPFVFDYSYTFTSFSDGSLFSLLLIIFLITYAHSDTTYLCSRPMTRWSIWVGGIAYIVLMAAVFAIVRLVLALAGYGAVAALSSGFPEKFALSAQTAWGAFYPARSLTVLWDAFRGLLATGLIAYAYGCLLRRWRGWTIALSILVPLLLLTLTVMPTVYLLMNDLEGLLDSNDVAAMLQVLPGWLSLIQRVVEWFVEYFDIVYWSVVAACVPVSLLVMRTTRQT